MQFFSKPADLLLDDLSNLATSELSTFKDYSLTGLEYAIATHKTVDLLVSIATPTLIVFAPDDNSAFIMDLGSLCVKSSIFSHDVSRGAISDDNLYDQFTISMDNMQVAVVSAPPTELVTRRYLFLHFFVCSLT